MIGRASAQRVSEKATAIKSVEKENGGKRTVFSAADDRSVRGGEYFGDYKMREKDGEVDEDEDEEGRRKQKGMMMYDEVPQCFICPISKEMMRDPVVVESGEVSKLLFYTSTSVVFIFISVSCSIKMFDQSCSIGSSIL